MSQVRVIKRSEVYMTKTGGKRFLHPALGEDVENENPVTPVTPTTPTTIDDETLDKKLTEALNLENDVEPIADGDNSLAEALLAEFNKKDDEVDLEQAIKEEWSKE